MRLAVVSLAAHVAQAYGATDVLVNNAGVSLIKRAEDDREAAWTEQW
jgi:NAD(P)-dependent dehydrogenase (short-subunit alcohol dehydrogenase family)